MEYADNMFAGAASFTGIGLQNWDTSKLLSAHAMFADTKSFNRNIGMWNVTSNQDFGKCSFCKLSVESKQVRI